MGVMTTGGATVAAESGDTTSDTAGDKDSRPLISPGGQTRSPPSIRTHIPSTLSAAVLVAAPYSFLAWQL